MRLLWHSVHAFRDFGRSMHSFVGSCSHNWMPDYCSSSCRAQSPRRAKAPECDGPRRFAARSASSACSQVVLRRLSRSGSSPAGERVAR
jgi:hypothetical protein